MLYVHPTAQSTNLDILRWAAESGVSVRWLFSQTLPQGISNGIREIKYLSTPDVRPAMVMHLLCGGFSRSCEIQHETLIQAQLHNQTT